MKRLKRLTRKKYRITALVLALCMTLSLLPISALAAGTDLAGKAIEEGTFAATGGNVNYRIDGEEIVITGGDDTVSEIVFPDEIDGKPVTRIEVSAFGNSGGHNETLTSVIFPANLTSIGGYAFHDVPGLTNIDFSKCTQSLTIGEWAFAGRCNCNGKRLHRRQSVQSMRLYCKGQSDSGFGNNKTDQSDKTGWKYRCHQP